MGWRELRAWLREMRRALKEERGLAQTAPDSWDGYEQDGWWAEQRQKARAGR